MFQDQLADPRFESLPNQLATPPYDMVMSSYYSLILTVNFVILALVAAWVIIDCRKSGRLLPLFILIGGSAACLQECIYDVLMNVWYAQYGATPLYRIFNVSVPMWMFLAYSWFIGGQSYFMYKKFRQGITWRQLWMFSALFFVADLFLEVPPLQFGNIYAYYGNQPFKFFGFPMWMAFTNCLIPITVGVTLASFDDILRGPRALLAIPMVPVLVGATVFAPGWPIFLALNSGAGYGVTRAAGLVTIGLSVLITYLVGVKFCKSAAHTALAETRTGMSRSTASQPG